MNRELTLPATVAAIVGRVVIAIDHENVVATWWAAASNDWQRPSCLAPFFDEQNITCVATDPATAARAAEWCERLPGWADGPDYAQHPLLFQAERSFLDGDYDGPCPRVTDADPTDGNGEPIRGVLRYADEPFPY